MLPRSAVSGPALEELSLSGCSNLEDGSVEHALCHSPVLAVYQMPRGDMRCLPTGLPCSSAASVVSTSSHTPGSPGSAAARRSARDTSKLVGVGPPV